MKKEKKTEKILPEWSHRISAEDIGLTPVRTTISASPQERKDLARRLQIESLDALEARLVLERHAANHFIHVTGQLNAKIVQLCVVTLEPVTEDIEAPVEGWFADSGSAVSLVRVRHEKQGRKMDAELPMLEEEDDPEPLIDGEVDLGELVAQHLSLAINPYPHKEGVVIEENNIDPGAIIPKTRQNPFAALKDWKREGKHKS